MLTLLLFLATILSLCSGSFWLISLSLTALLVKLYPVLLLLLALGGVGLLSIYIFKR